MTDPLLDARTLERVRRLRFVLRRRVDGRFTGAHAARAHGSSLTFADYRDYAPGDDPRLLDPHAYARLGKMLVKLFEAEDTAAVRVVVDCSASMGFGDKRDAAVRTAALLVALAAAGGDRSRVLLAGETVEAGPWYRGPGALAGADARLRDLRISPGGADLEGALRRAHGEGPPGPVVLVSDLLTEDWARTVHLLGGGRGDAVLVHLLGRLDLEPALRGDLRLADAETGAEVEVALDANGMARFEAARDAWLDGVDRTCGARAILVARVVDDDPVADALTGAFARLGLVA